jgi:hypothetical protein
LRAALVLVAATLVACSVEPPAAQAPPGPAPAQASDLRTQLDLLLSEHAIVIAKESAAALNGSSEYRAYALLLSTNETALTEVVRRAVGNTSADAFAHAWRALNTDVVDYAIRMATHDADKATADASRLTSDTLPTLARELAGITMGKPDELLVSLNAEMTALRATIDSAAAHHYAAIYTSLGTSVTASTALGDRVAAGIAHRFPDRFPDDPASAEASRRARLNVLLQQRAYLVTMATDAQVNGRADEGPEALHALAANIDLIAADLHDSKARDLWTGELASIQLYAKSGDADSRQALAVFANRLVSMTNATPNAVSNQVDATVKVIDDQRAKDADNVADDDRAAATAMQPIADSL